MPHFRVDDAFHAHPKAVQAGDEALGLWTRAGSYCMAYLTDGWVPLWWVLQQKRGKILAKRLVNSGLWSEFSRENEAGFMFHQFTGPGRQDSRETIEADREKARQRQEAWRLSRRDRQRDSRCDIQGESRSDIQRESRRIPGYTQPNPTQPNPLLTVVTYGGDVTQVGPNCPRHPNGTSEACGACADARRAHQAAQADQLEAERERRRWRQAAIDACPDCDDKGLLDIGDNEVIRCDHDEALRHA
jgi:hypothetical protein